MTDIDMRWEDGAYHMRASQEIPEASWLLRAYHTTQHHASKFRDIRAYSAWRRDPATSTIYASYESGVPFLRFPVTLEIDDSRRDVLTFRTQGNPFIQVQGSWSFASQGCRTTRVQLDQTVTPIALPTWLPLGRLLRSRVLRAFEDMCT